MSQRKPPGVMIYYDLMNLIKRLNNDERGQLLTAILEYGKLGRDPDFGENVKLLVVWDDVQPRIDKDHENYQKKAEIMRNNINRRWNREASDTDVYKCNDIVPTTTATATATAPATATAAAAAEKEFLPSSLPPRARGTESGYEKAMAFAYDRHRERMEE